MEYLENALSIPEEAMPPDFSATSLVITPLTDSDYFIPPLANFCVTSLPTNSEEADIYLRC